MENVYLLNDVKHDCIFLTSKLEETHLMPFLIKSVSILWLFGAIGSLLVGLSMKFATPLHILQI